MVLKEFSLVLFAHSLICFGHSQNGNRYATHWRKEQEACTTGNGAGVGTGLAPLVRMVTSCLVL